MEVRHLRVCQIGQGRRLLALAALMVMLGRGGAAWQIETVDDGTRLFTSMNERSVALDAEGNPHFAYGGDHLYYA